MRQVEHAVTTRHHRVAGVAGNDVDVRCAQTHRVVEDFFPGEHLLFGTGTIAQLRDVFLDTHRVGRRERHLVAFDVRPNATADNVRRGHRADVQRAFHQRHNHAAGFNQDVRRDDVLENRLVVQRVRVDFPQNVQHVILPDKPVTHENLGETFLCYRLLQHRGRELFLGNIAAFEQQITEHFRQLLLL